MTYKGFRGYMPIEEIDLKCGFSMERMPSSFFKANAIFFRIGCLAYNLFRILGLTEYVKC